MADEALYEVLFDIATNIRKAAENLGRIATVLENPITVRIREPYEDDEYEEEEQQVEEKQPIVIEEEDEKE